MKLKVVDVKGADIESIEVEDSVFGITPNEPVVHQVLVAQLAARRSGSANTKTRGEVRGSTRKLRRQKGLGMARVGSNRTPVRRGGGVAFGPKPRNYTQRLPRKMKHLAICSVLSDRIVKEKITVVDSIELDKPSTKSMINIFNELGISESSLIVTEGIDRIIVRSARNIPHTGVTQADILSVIDMLSFEHMLLTVDAVRQIENLWGKDSKVGTSSESEGDV
ncbi:MAG: 50S ribosomal protein L4 [Chloroflexi bacterium]|nr:50S ribosomal protein L4 [Chloroflexota bacterium]|tara:strand:+ start:809 stop:1474 length:666 start_codon:yes stop_codon:yes gene_type:complete